MAKKKRDPKTVAIAQAILEQYNPQSAEDVNNALKDIFGPMFEAMLQGEMNHHLGYENNDKSSKKTDNRRNGYGTKKDLNAALCYYYDYICISGCTEKINKEIEEIYTELVKQNPETAENEYTEFLSNWVLVSRNKSNEKAKKWYLEGIEEARKRLSNL